VTAKLLSKIVRLNRRMPALSATSSGVGGGVRCQPFAGGGFLARARPKR